MMNLNQPINENQVILVWVDVIRGRQKKKISVLCSLAFADRVLTFYTALFLLLPLSLRLIACPTAHARIIYLIIDNHFL